MSNEIVAEPDMLGAAESIYSSVVAAQATMMGNEGISFAAVGSSLGEPHTAEYSINTDANPAGWSTLTTPSSDGTMTSTTVILEGDVTQTLVAPLASVQSVAAKASSTSTNSLSPGGVRVALGVGLGVGIPGLLALLAAFFVVYKRRQTKREFAERTRHMIASQSPMTETA